MITPLYVLLKSGFEVLVINASVPVRPWLILWILIPLWQKCVRTCSTERKNEWHIDMDYPKKICGNDNKNHKNHDESGFFSTSRWISSSHPQMAPALRDASAVLLEGHHDLGRCHMFGTTGPAAGPRSLRCPRGKPNAINQFVPHIYSSCLIGNMDSHG